MVSMLSVATKGVQTLVYAYRCHTISPECKIYFARVFSIRCGGSDTVSDRESVRLPNFYFWYYLKDGFRVKTAGQPELRPRCDLLTKTYSESPCRGIPSISVEKVQIFVSANICLFVVSATFVSVNPRSLRIANPPGHSKYSVEKGDSSADLHPAHDVKVGQQRSGRKQILRHGQKK